MRFPSLALSGLLLSTTLPALAQTTPAETPALPGTAAPRFFVGLGAYSSYYQPLESRSTNVTGLPVPVQLTAGYQLRPRLALQAGLAYQSSSYAYAQSYYLYGTSNSPEYRSYAGSSRSRGLSASVLARYTLTRNAAHRVQFDALGGFTLQHYFGRDQGTRVDSLGGTRNSSPYTNRYSETSLLLTAGLGTRYRLSRHFDLTLDLLLNRAVLGDTYTPPMRLGLTGSSALGLRYRFGR